MIVEKGSRRVIGGQIIGGENVASKLDTIALAIHSKISADDLVTMDACYTPTLADTLNPISLAAELALRNLDKGI